MNSKLAREYSIIFARSRNLPDSWISQRFYGVFAYLQHPASSFGLRSNFTSSYLTESSESLQRRHDDVRLEVPCFCCADTVVDQFLKLGEGPIEWLDARKGKEQNVNRIEFQREGCLDDSGDSHLNLQCLATSKESIAR